MAETSTAETNTPDTNASETSDSSGLSSTLSNILSALGDLAQLLRHIFRLRYRNLPAVPLASIPSLIDTLIKLGKRSVETQPALDGLSNIYTIDGHTATGQEFLFGESGRDVQAEGDREALRERLESGGDLSESEGSGTLSTLFEQALDGDSNADEASDAEATEGSELTKLFLDTPDQWSISWTNFMGVYDNAQPQLPVWARTVTVSPEGAQAATEAFWPNIADYGLAYNLLILAKVDANRVVGLRAAFGSHFDAFEGAFAEGRLYAIDMSLFQQVSANKVDGFERFTPATITLLEMSSNKDLLPVAVRVSGQNDRDHQIYVHGQATEATWIYALQAAKVSITVWGIWLGHVYHWHLVTAAMQKTMLQNVPEGHPIYQLLAPQSDYLIPFDNILLLLWRAVAPPTSLSTAGQFLDLANSFARGRRYFDDDPINTLERQGIEVADFSDDGRPWNRFRIAGYLLDIWQATEDYVAVFVNTTFADDAAVAADEDLQNWIAAASSRRDGNIRGLPTMDTRQALREVLTSLIYRITIHGSSRLNSAANPALTFVANYEPCLQTSAIPEPDQNFETKKLLDMLPNTGTIGNMVTFYFTFVFSAPYVPFIPLEGVEANLFFDGGLADPRNQALVDYRNAVIRFIEAFEQGNPQIHQWPLNIET